MTTSEIVCQQGLDPESENDLETSGHKDAASSSRPSMIIEDVYKEECSSCPLTADKCESDQQVAQECCHKGKRFLDAINWTRAMEMFSQGVVADPSNAACWIGLSRVKLHDGLKTGQYFRLRFKTFFCTRI